MKNFKYVARRKDDKTTDGWVSAPSQIEAQKIIEERGMSVVLLKEATRKKGLNVNRDNLITLFRELATLRLSGMQLNFCISSLIETSSDKVLTQALKRIFEELESGSSLSLAIDSQPDVFPFYVASMLKLGEANGNISEALFNIADRLEREEKLISEVKSALTYPMFLLIVCVSVIFFLFTYVIPNFKSMINEDSPANSLKTLIGISDFFNDNIVILLILIAVVIAGIIAGLKTGKLQQGLVRTLNLIPFFKKLTVAWNIVQFSSSMQKLLESGVDLVEAVELSKNGIADDHIRRRLENVAGRVRQGEGLADSLEYYNVFPLVVIRLIKTGEIGASLPPCFKELNNLYERRLSKSLKQVLSILEPLVIVIMGGIVGAIMIILISGIISVNDIGF